MKTESEYLEFVKKMVDDGAVNMSDFQPMIVFHIENDEPRLIFFPQMSDEESRQKIAEAVAMMASSIDNLTSITFSMDTWHTTSPTKSDGTPWGFGEMDEAFHGDTVDADLVFEAFCHQVVTPDGKIAMTSVPYVRSEGDKVDFQWDEATVLMDEGDGKGGGLDGFIPNIMRNALGAPKLFDLMVGPQAPEQWGLDEAEARLHILSVGTKMAMQRTQMPCLIPCHSEDEEALIRESMKSGPMSEGIRPFSRDDITEIAGLHDIFQQPAFGEAEEEG